MFFYISNKKTKKIKSKIIYRIRKISIICGDLCHSVVFYNNIKNFIKKIKTSLQLYKFYSCQIPTNERFLVQLFMIMTSFFVERCKIRIKGMQRKVRWIYKRALMCLLFERGELSIEGALTIPVFLFATIGFLYFFVIMGVDLKVYTAMENAGNEIGKAYVLSESFENTLTSDLAIKTAIVSELGVDNIKKSCIENGVMGINVRDSSYENGFLTMVVKYNVKIPFIMGDLGGIKRELKLCSKLFVGKEIFNEEECVYVTKNGTVYHRDRNCTYLNPSLKPITFGELVNTVNNSGEHYSICDVCLDNLKTQGMEEDDLDYGDIVYVTNEGNKYHLTIDCVTVKREVEVKKLSEVAGMKECSKCGADNYEE